MRGAGPELVWRAPLFDVSGYASGARDFVLGLAAAGARVRAEPIPWLPAQPAVVGADLGRLRELMATTVGPRAVRVDHAFPRFWRVRAGGGSVGRTMFETDRIPPDWVPVCNEAREVWVPTRWNAETFTSAGVDPARLRVVPEPIRIEWWERADPPLELGAAGAFTFLSVFDWSLRKGWDVLLRAYCREFGGDDDVVLVLRVHSSYGATADELRALAGDFCAAERRGRPPRIVVLDQVVPAVDLPRLYRAADCFVLPTRGEGWGRPFVEAMAAGTPVIGTRWGGHTEYMDDANAYLVDVEAVVPVPEAALREAPAFRGHRWAEPAPEHLQRLMRLAYDRPEEALARAGRAREDVRRYEASAVCAGVLERVAALGA